MTGIPFPRTTTVQGPAADDGRMFIIVALVVLVGLVFVAVRFVRPRLTVAQSQQLFRHPRRQPPRPQAAGRSYRPCLPGR